MIKETQIETIPSPESIISSEIKAKIELIDKTIFPNNPLNVQVDADTETKFVAAHRFDDKDYNNASEHFYSVWEKGIHDSQIDGKDNPEKEILRIALHEVRHRVQHDLNVKMITLEDLEQFIVEDPKTLLQTYFSSPSYKNFLEVAMSKSKNDFDAMVVEGIAIKLLRGDYSGENIKIIADSVIKQSADIVLEYLKSIVAKIQE